MVQRLAQVLEDRWLKPALIVLDDTRNATHDAVGLRYLGLYTSGLSQRSWYHRA